MNELLELHSLLQTYGLTPNRALGQNFCIDRARLAQIAAAADVAGMPVLEVGPGLGALTAALITAGAKRIVAVEKDRRIAGILRVEMDDLRLRVVAEDFLDFDVAAHFGDEPFAACGNLPYYVTTPIVEKLLCFRPVSMVLMVQKEAAARFFAAPSTRVYGPLTVLANTFYTPSVVMDVPRTSYYPAPAVDSLVVRLAARTPLPDADADGFLLLLKQLFAKRRKTIKNNYPDAEAVAPLCEQAGIDPGARAESLPPEALFRFYQAAAAFARSRPPDLIRL